MSRLRSHLPLVGVVSAVSFGSITFGYSAAVIGTSLGQPSFLRHMGLDTHPNAAGLIGAMNALFFVGGVFSSFFQGWFAHKYGRKAAIATGCIMVILSGALLTASVNAAMFIVFRFFNGWGAFQLLAGVPLFITEIANPAHRGIVADIHAVGLNVGYTVSGYIGLGFYFTGGLEAWRAPMAIQMAPPLILLLALYWLPESPRWLLANGREDEAWRVVLRLHSGLQDGGDPEFARKEFFQMKVQSESDRLLDDSYVAIAKRPSFRRRAFITMFLTFTLFSSGTLVINNYGVLLYTELGYGTTEVLLFQTGWTACALVFNLVAMIIVDRFARNKLMSIGFFLVMATLIVHTAVEKTYVGTKNHGGLAGAVFTLYAFIVFYSIFLDGPTYFYIGEIWPTHLRAKGYALGIAALALANIIWLQASPTAFANIGWRFYIVFIVFAALGCVVSGIYFPNTLHKPLEEVAELFGDDDLVEIYSRDITSEAALRDETLSKDVTVEMRESVPSAV